MKEEFHRIVKQLHSSEEILWKGKPVLVPFVFSGYQIIPFLIGVLFVVVSVTQLIIPITLFGATTEFIVFTLIFSSIGFAFAFGTPIIFFFSYRNTEYVLTNQRLITQTGALGLDTRFVDFKKIQEVSVQVGFVDSLFKTGNVFAETASVVPVGYVQMGGQYSYIIKPSLKAIKEPYKVQLLLQTAMKQAKESNHKED